MKKLNNPFVIYGYKGAEYIYQYNGGYIVYDRFFGMWLRERIE